MKRKTFFISLLAILSALFFAFGLLLLLGKSPVTFLVTLVSAFFNDRNGNLLTSFVMRMIPLTFTALGIALAFRTGLFNIGAEGQFGMGLFGAIIVGAIPGIPLGLHLLLVLISAFCFGALWGFIPGFFRAYFSVHEVVLTIMMNYIALYLLKGLLLPLVAVPDAPHQVVAPQATATLNALFGDAKILRVPVNYWVFFGLMLLGIGVYYVLVNKTKFGFELRAGGLNEHAARYAGMNSKRNLMLSLMLAGGFAGIGGAFYFLSGATIATTGYVHTGYGFEGLAAALLGGSTAVGTLAGSGILAYLNAISTRIQQVVGIPREITEMIVALILFFIAIAYVFELAQQWFVKHHKGGRKGRTRETLELPQEEERI